MNTRWPVVRLGAVLRQDTAYIEAPEPHTYPKLSVKLYGKGVTLDSPTDGASLKMQRHQLAKAGQVILSEIWGKKGAIGLVPKEGEGALCTSHFFLLDVLTDEVEPDYLGWIFKANFLEDQLDAEAKGTTGYAAVRPKHLAACEIPLPPLPEQRRIVARIDELATEIKRAQSLHHESVQEASAVVHCAIGQVLDNAGWLTEPLGNLLLESPRNGLSPKPVEERGGRPMLRINAVSSSLTRFVDLTAIKQVETSDQEAAPFVLRHDDVFIVRYNGDINRVAKAAIFKGDNESQIAFPDKLMRLRPNANRMLPDFLVFALSAPSVRKQIDELGKTTAGNIGISGGNAKSFVIPVPPLSDQRWLVDQLDSLQAEMDTLKLLQSRSGNELDMLMPAILDRAFKGEL